MRIVFEINHPGQVHLLKNVYFDLINKGHFVKVFAKKEPSITNLLDRLCIPFISIGRKGKGLYGKFISQIFFSIKMLLYVYFNKIKIGVGSSMTNDHVSAFSLMKSIHLSDDDEEVVPLMKKYAYPFSDIILSPDCVKIKSFNHKNITYSGYHELAYLHPKRFIPNPLVLNEIGLDTSSVFFILRFNSFQAHHDVGERGLSFKQKKEIIEILRNKGKIFITTEGKIDTELEDYMLRLSSEKIHSLLYYATLFIGDSQTMTSEAAVLGTPAIRCNSFVGRISYLEEEEYKYGLTYGFKPEDFSSLINKVNELLSMENLKKEWQLRRQQMLKDKIDVTDFMVWFIENYPQSAQIMRENSDYQFRFK